MITFSFKRDCGGQYKTMRSDQDLTELKKSGILVQAWPWTLRQTAGAERWTASDENKELEPLPCAVALLPNRKPSPATWCFFLQINTFSQVKHYRKKKKIHRIELVRTVDRLVESKAIHQISLHLKRVNVRERLLGPDEGFFSQSDQRLKFHLVSISHIATPQPQTSVLGANCPLWRVSRESHFTCEVKNWWWL